MDNPFKISKSYRIRHEILGVLYKDWEANGKSLDRRVGSIKIANDTNIAIGYIHQVQYLLVDKGEVIISDNDGQSMMSLQSIGITSYIDRKYIREGRKNRLDNIFDWARIIIPLAALILSIINFYANRTTESRVNHLQNQININNK